MAQAAAYPHWKTRFFTVWTGQAFSLFGSQLVQFALIWWLTETTRSATVLASAALVGVLPQVLISPIAGPLIDRWNRKRVMMVADALVAFTTLLLVLLFAGGVVQLWHVYLAMFIRSAAGSFHFPSMQASTSLMVPDEHLSRVAGLNQMLQGLMSIVAPPVGALLIGLLPMQGVLLIDVVTAAVAVLAVLVVPIPQPERQPTADVSPLRAFWRDMGSGFNYVRGWPGLMAVIVLVMLLNLIAAPALSLVPLLVTNIFGGQAGELATLNSAMGIGIVVGGVILGVWGGFKRRITTSMMAVFIMSVALLLIGFAPASAFWLALAAFFVLGVMHSLANGPLMALLQSIVAPEMQGRVFTLLMSGAALMMPLGLAVAGPLADQFGVQWMYVMAGALSLLMTITALFIPALMNIERNHQPQGALEATAGAD
ncbi:MAG: MFS transporter [Chloroflexi bacterium]|nr:MFS transporter [Chloroflexota bacterium]